MKNLIKTAEVYTYDQFRITVAGLNSKLVACMIEKKDNETFTLDEVNQLRNICKNQIAKMYSRKKLEYLLTHQEKNNILVTPLTL